ncbi:MAG: ROK family protein [Clostridia bacterium]|nr:ROK family protein [Clostridia bacterium]
MYFIGIDLGGTNIAAGIVDENYNIVLKGSTPTLVNRAPELIVKDMAKLCLSLLEKAGIDISEIAHVGIAAPGSINPETGVIEYSNNIPLLNFPISEILRKYLPIKEVYLENDANAAALGEAVAGAAKGKNISVMVTLGTGVGGGVVINGHIYSGFNYAGAELGHTVIEYNGRPCTCGRKGCFEAYSSATALVNLTKEKLSETKDTIMWEMCDGDISKANARIAFSAMKKGDKAGKEVVDTYISYLACGITNLINIFQPEVLLIGGGVCNEKEYLTAPLIDIVNKDQYTRNQPIKTEIKVAELGNDAGIVGAAAIGRQK